MSRQAEDFEWFKSVLDRVTYKPKWRLTTYRHAVNGDVMWSGEFLAPDADLPVQFGSPSAPVRSTCFVPLPLLVSRDADYVIEWLISRVTQMEYHERDEWFRVDGKHVHEPHGVDLG